MLKAMKLAELRFAIVLVALFVTTVFGYLSGAARASSDATASDMVPGFVETTLSSSRDGETDVVVDDASGQICATSNLGRAKADACTSTTAAEPMLMYASDEQGRVLLTVVDPSGKVHTVNVTALDGIIFSADALPGAIVSYTATTDGLPLRVELIDKSSHVIATFTPAADDERANGSQASASG
jgi:PKD repeat protein